MPTTMNILGWKAKGLRCPDHELTCCDFNGDPLPTTLIQMPNGTGKTTTLSLLRAALSGDAKSAPWSKSRILEFQKRDNPAPDGTFELRLLLNDKRVTIVMEFDFENGRVYYKTTRGHGQVQGFDPPVEFRRFMRKDFVKFYVFDGELADNILSRDHTDAEQAVESLFQTHLLEFMKRKISDYWDNQTRGVTAKDRTGFTRRKNRTEKWRSRLANLKKQKAEYRGELVAVLDDLRRQKLLYDSAIKNETDRASRVRDAEDKVDEFHRDVHESAQSILDAIREPQAISAVFATAMYELKDGLDRVKLPESAAREFFEELADEDYCVCGRPIDDQIKGAIRERAQQYLGSDDVALLNNMKGAIDEAVGQTRGRASQLLSREIDSLTALVGEELKAGNQLDELRLEAERSDPNVMRAKKEIDRLEEEEIRLRGELERFAGKDERVNLDRIGHVDPERIFSIDTVREGVAIVEDQFDEVRNTLNLRRKRDILNSIISKAHVKSRAHIAAEIKDDANDRIAELMPDNRIRVEKIDRCIILKDQATGSAGENLSIGYAFLATLFNRAGEHQLPFVVDSPANPIDYDIRPQIARLAPILTHQFIAFLISSERERFVPSLVKASGKDIKYITLFRKGVSRHEEKAQRIPSCIESTDGYLVVDEHFFAEFQLDIEDE